MAWRKLKEDAQSDGERVNEYSSHNKEQEKKSESGK